jgi:hypothetical protein
MRQILLEQAGEDDADGWPDRERQQEKQRRQQQQIPVQGATCRRSGETAAAVARNR